MNSQNLVLVNANEAVAQIAYKTNEIFPIYPITPASPMSELVEEWSAKHYKNIFGSVPIAFQMQGEGGVAGTMHGALQTGSLSTTFTASQGLLLMLPNMYKIAGELTPNVIHVATRSIATHALSVFGDHSDVMAVRQSGYAMLASASVQEAKDMALIAQTATLKSRIPFLHFFDGFRTSHETQVVEKISDEVLLKMMDVGAIIKHRKRALSPDNPVIRGTSQASDTFFQGREATNVIYDKCPDVVQQTMTEFAELTGRKYKLFDYFGHPEAEYVLVTMASSSETAEETVKHLNAKGEKVGIITVRLYRPFSKKHMLSVLPKSCKKLVVLDRAKEPGSTGEPLFLDILQTITDAFQNNEIAYLPYTLGGRYGLSSKEFTPSMVLSVFENLKSDFPKKSFTVGIEDDITHRSLPIKNNIDLLRNCFQVLVYGHKSEDLQNRHAKFLKDFGSEKQLFLQSYVEIDYKKSNSRNVYNLRISQDGIRAPYLIESADLVICESLKFLVKDNVLKRIRQNGILVISSESEKDIWSELSVTIKKEIQSKNIWLFKVNPNSGFDLAHDFIPFSWDFQKDFEEYGLKGIETNNLNTEETIKENETFSKTFLGRLLSGEGDLLPVSDFPIDGTFPTDTSKYLGDRNKGYLPVWDPNACTQCGLCSLVCPQAAIRPKVFPDDLISPDTSFKHVKASQLGATFNLLNYTLQINPTQCTSCNSCVDTCDHGALKMKNSEENFERQKRNWEYFEAIPEVDRNLLDTGNPAQQQLQEPLFKYSLGEDGCGQAPYLKLLSQLFGDRMLVANATGASSIVGGALPVTPWSKNGNGKGPAWSNSLFEDNAEFGLGFQLSQIQLQKQASSLLDSFRGVLDEELIDSILSSGQTSEKEIIRQRELVEKLKSGLMNLNNTKARRLMDLVDHLVKKSIWIVGGDGWAYDIGYGGLDHVLSSGENVNILVLDNELYSNTGGQQSKATPKGASAKFGFNSKEKKKKDLGKLAMHYENTYVASVAIGANPQQTLKAFIEAESHNGPSLIIAYCHSSAHGIDTKYPRKHQKAAVDSGHWKLYRYNPKKGSSFETRYQLDSNAPTLEVSDYYAMEARFQKFLEQSPELVEKIQ